MQFHLPVRERRNANPDSVTGRLERAWGWPGVGLVGFAGAGVVFAAVGALAWASGLPWLFPSLAPTVVLMFETPLRPQASPRNAVLGHAVGIGVGYGMLVAFGLEAAAPITAAGVIGPRIAAAALAVAVTTLLLNSAAIPHPPATASTLIVGLGLLRDPIDLTVMFAAVVLVTGLCWSLNRIGGVEVPRWSPRR